jgi:hypothetical protein
MGRGFCAIRGDDTLKKVFGKLHVNASFDGNGLVLFDRKYKNHQIFRSFSSLSPILYDFYSQNSRNGRSCPRCSACPKSKSTGYIFSSFPPLESPTPRLYESFSKIQTSTAMALFLDPIYLYSSTTLLKIANSRHMSSSLLLQK